MSTRTRTLAGLVLMLVSVVAAAVFLHLFLRAGFPRPQDGAKWVVYLWLLSLSVALPATAGVALVRHRRSWRRFAGWWLLAAGGMAFGSLWWFGPAYRDWLLTLVVGSAVCVLPAVGGGVLMLLSTRRAGRRIGQRSSTDPGTQTGRAGAAADPVVARDPRRGFATSAPFLKG